MISMTCRSDQNELYDSADEALAEIYRAKSRKSLRAATDAQIVAIVAKALNVDCGAAAERLRVGNWANYEEQKNGS